MVGTGKMDGWDWVDGLMVGIRWMDGIGWMDDWDCVDGWMRLHGWMGLDGRKDGWVD